MKKTLLLGVAVALGFSAFAQSNRQAAYLYNKTLNKGGHKIDNSAFPAAGTKRVSGPASSQAVCTPDPFTSGPNVFGVGGGVTTYKQACLTYNKDLNSYIFTHRRSAEWAAQQAMGSGSIQATYKKITGGAWDSTIIYYDPSNAAAARYPNGAFYNPSGNTNWANVWAVGTGPVLGPGAASFDGTWYSARQLTGTAADYTLPGADLNYVYAPALPFGNTLFMNTDIQQVGTKMLTAGDLSSDTTTSTAPDFNHYIGAVIGKADFTGGTPVWGKDSIVPGYAYYGAPGRLGFTGTGDGRLAFFGQTGYWVDLGRLATNYGNSADSMVAPVVYKTTDGGATWAPVLQGYDWNCRHPELMKNVGMIYTTPSKYWQLNFKHGIDVTCDANGMLHLVGTMVSQVGDGVSPDSASIYSLTYTHDYDWYHPVMWDLMTDGTNWKSMLIDSVMTAYLGGDPASDSTASFNPITDGSGGYLPFGARLQVSRSFDGTKVFYSWAQSDPNVTGTPYNTQPDLWMKAYDVNTGMVTASTNITNGVGTCFFHMMADQAYYDTANSKWVCPMVYSLPRTQPSPGVYDGVSATDHIWVDCGAFGTADFTTTAVINNESSSCMIGVQTFGTFANAVNAYPNPFSSNTSIVVSLSEVKTINVEVFDALGNLVSSKKVNGNLGENTIKFDGSSLTAGVYYYTVTAGYEKVTKKLVIQK